MQRPSRCQQALMHHLEAGERAQADLGLLAMRWCRPGFRMISIALHQMLRQAIEAIQLH
jgi:hypothetical protein